jgi:hypothetical protein
MARAHFVCALTGVVGEIPNSEIRRRRAQTHVVCLGTARYQGPTYWTLRIVRFDREERHYRECNNEKELGKMQRISIRARKSIMQ